MMRHFAFACRQAALWSIVSAAPQALVALPSYLFVETFTSLLPVALGFAAGCMIWIVFSELFPDALAALPASDAATAATLSAAWLQISRNCYPGVIRALLLRIWMRSRAAASLCMSYCIVFDVSDHSRFTTTATSGCRAAA